MKLSFRIYKMERLVNIATLLVILAAGLADADKCFECSNVDMRATFPKEYIAYLETAIGKEVDPTVSSKCNDPFDPFLNNNLLVNCNGSCWKNDGDTGFVWRFCYPNAPICPYKDMRDENDAGTNYCCMGDNCNAASSVSHTITLLTITALALALYLVY